MIELLRDDAIDNAIREEIEVAREMFVQNVYRANRVFEEGDRWLDIGCHSGWFSWQAILHGAGVVGGVDADARALQRYAAAIPYVNGWHRCISSGAELTEVVLEALRDHANALKLDIQGSERFLLMPGGWSFANAIVDDVIIEKLLMEWHYPEKLPEIITQVEDNEFGVEYVDRAVDVLTGIQTHIIYARRKR